MSNEKMDNLDLDFNTLKGEITQKISSLAKNVYKKDIDKCSMEEIKDLIELDSLIGIGKMVVNVSSTRQVEAYTPNTYGASLEIDFTESYNHFLEKVKQQPTPNLAVEKYIQLRSTFFALVSSKFKNTEAYLRDLCRESEEKDFVKGIGRYNT